MRIEESYVPMPGDIKCLEYILHFDKKQKCFKIEWKSDWDDLPVITSTDYKEIKKLVQKAGRTAVKQFASLGKKIMIGVKSNAFEDVKTERWHSSSGLTKHDGCTISFAWCIVEEFDTKSDYQRFMIIEQSRNVWGRNHGKYTSGWDIFGSDWKTHLLEKTDKNIKFCKDFEESMQNMIDKVTNVMKDTKNLRLFIQQSGDLKLIK